MATTVANPAPRLQRYTQRPCICGKVHPKNQYTHMRRFLWAAARNIVNPEGQAHMDRTPPCRSARTNKPKIGRLAGEAKTDLRAVSEGDGERIYYNSIPGLRPRALLRVIDYNGQRRSILSGGPRHYGVARNRSQNDRRPDSATWMRHWHSTPFEMCRDQAPRQLPVFVARRWIRHRTRHVNGILRPLFDLFDREFYHPEPPM